MSFVDRYAGDWKAFISTLSVPLLLSVARDYLWLAEFGPPEGRDTFSMKRDCLVAELQERGLNSELVELRKKLAERVPREQKGA